MIGYLKQLIIFIFLKTVLSNQMLLMNENIGILCSAETTKVVYIVITTGAAYTYH